MDFIFPPASECKLSSHRKNKATFYCDSNLIAGCGQKVRLLQAVATAKKFKEL